MPREVQSVKIKDNGNHHSVASGSRDCAVVRKRGRQEQHQRKPQPPMVLRGEYQGHKRRDDKRHGQSCKQVEFIARIVDCSVGVAWHHDVDFAPEHDGVEAIPVACAPFCRPQCISEGCWENFRLRWKALPEDLCRARDTGEILGGNVGVSIIHQHLAAPAEAPSGVVIDGASRFRKAVGRPIDLPNSLEENGNEWHLKGGRKNAGDCEDRYRRAICEMVTLRSASKNLGKFGGSSGAPLSAKPAPDHEGHSHGCSTARRNRAPRPVDNRSTTFMNYHRAVMERANDRCRIKVGGDNRALLAVLRRTAQPSVNRVRWRRGAPLGSRRRFSSCDPRRVRKEHPSQASRRVLRLPQRRPQKSTDRRRANRAARRAHVVAHRQV